MADEKWRFNLRHLDALLLLSLPSLRLLRDRDRQVAYGRTRVSARPVLHSHHDWTAEVQRLLSARKAPNVRSLGRGDRHGYDQPFANNLLGRRLWWRTGSTAPTDRDCQEEISWCARPEHDPRHVSL